MHTLTFGGTCLGPEDEGSGSADELGKGERHSPCGQFIINGNGEWRPNPACPPSREGARDPAVPVVSTRPPVKYGRRATPTGRTSSKAHTLPKDKSYETLL